jgi:hypothetical protein
MGAKGTVFASIEDVWLNALTSSLGTPLWNMASMASLTAMRIGERALARGFGDPDAVAGEAGVYAQSLLNSYWKLFVLKDPKMIKKFAKEQERASGVFNPDKLDARTAAKMAIPTGSGSVFRSTGQYGRAVDIAGYMINTPRYLIASTDSLFRFAIKDAMVDTLAFRQATQFAETMIKRGAKLTPKEFDELVAKKRQAIIEDPNAKIDWRGDSVKLSEIAEKEASVIAMMDELQTPAGRAVDNWVRSHKAGRVILPFFRVMAITARETIHRAGPAALLLPNVRADLAAGGAQAAEAKAKMAMGTMIAASSGLLWSSGIMTDGGPLDPELNATWRAGGNDPYVIKVGDTHIPLQRLGVGGEILMYTADMLRAMAAIPATLDARAQDPNSDALKMAGEATAKLVAIHASLVGNDMMFDDMQRIMRAIFTADEAALKQVIEQRAGAVVPFSAMNKDIREYIYKERQSADGFLASLQKALPFGTRDGMSTARNAWGDKTAEFEGMNPLEIALGFTHKNAPRAETKNKVAEELVKNEISVLGPGRTFEKHDAVIRLNMGEWNELKWAFGHIQLARPAGTKGPRTMFVDQALEAAMQTKGWREGTPGTRGSRAKYAAQIVAPYAEAARGWLFSGLSFKQWGIEKRSPFAQSLQQRIQERAEYRQGESKEADFPGADLIRSFNIGGAE